MNLGDLNKVWEIKALKRKPRAEEAQKILEKLAKQVQPIMIKHKWRVKLLSEFCPKNARLLGLNVNGGVNVKLRLRRANKDDEFIPFHQVLDTMLHELCHNAHGPHNASFYNLWDEIRKECEELISKGITGSSKGFDIPGRRLGGFSRQPPLKSLRQTALAAAEKRVRLGSLLPSGPKRLGGDTTMMTFLSPIQAAAMAAERRLLDNIWCGAETVDASELGEDNDDEKAVEVLQGPGKCGRKCRFGAQDHVSLSQKRRRESSEVPSSSSYNGHLEANFLDLTSNKEYRSTSHHNESSMKRLSRGECLSHAVPLNGCSTSVDLTLEPSNSRVDRSEEIYCNEELEMWECGTCTLLNPPMAPICEVCSSQKPKDANGGQKCWSCKFCTLDNEVGSERCTACGEWRYSYGPPVAAAAPNRGT